MYIVHPNICAVYTRAEWYIQRQNYNNTAVKYVRKNLTQAYQL